MEEEEEEMEEEEEEEEEVKRGEKSYRWFPCSRNVEQQSFGWVDGHYGR